VTLTVFCFALRIRFRPGYLCLLEAGSFLVLGELAETRNSQRFHITLTGVRGPDLGQTGSAAEVF